MKRKNIIALLGVCMIGTLTACGNSDKVNISDNTEVNMSETVESDNEIEATDASVYKNYVELGDFKTILNNVSNSAVNVTDEQIEAQLTNYTTVLDGVVESGDIVMATLEAKSNGEKIIALNTTQASFSENNTELYGIDFYTACIGLENGGETQIKAVIPEGTGTDYDGQEVKFTLSVNSFLRKTSLDIYTDEYVSEISGGNCKNLDEYKAYLKDNLVNTTKYNELHLALETIISQSTFGDIKDLVSEEYGLEYADYEEQAKMHNMELEAYVKQYLNCSTMEDFENMLRVSAQSAVYHKIVIYTIADAEGITIGEDTYINDFINYFVGNMSDMGAVSD